MDEVSNTDVSGVEVPVTEVPTDVSGVEVPVTEVPTDLSGTDISGTEITPPVINYLFDIDNLVSEHDILLQKEAADRAIVDTIEFPDTLALKAKLVEWANRGFADAFSIFSITIQPPVVCSDGVSRSLFEYIAFLAGMPIGDKMKRLSDKLKGMTIQCSYSGNTVTFHVFKD